VSIWRQQGVIATRRRLLDTALECVPVNLPIRRGLPGKSGLIEYLLMAGSLEWNRHGCPDDQRTISAMNTRFPYFGHCRAAQTRSAGYVYLVTTSPEQRGFTNA
jgi:hypothetical protein